MNRTRDEVDDLLQKSRISRDLNQEPDYSPQRNYRPASGEINLSEPGLQSSSYDASDVGGIHLKSSKDAMLYPNSPSTHLPGAFPVNVLDDNKRSNNTSFGRHEQFEDESGITKNAAYSTDYAAGQIDNDPVLRMKENIAYQTSPSSEGASKLSSNVATDQKNINSTPSGQTQPVSQYSDGSTMNMGSNASGLNREYTAGQTDEDPTLGKKANDTGISGPAPAKTFGSSNMTSDPNSTGDNAGTAKKATAAAAATAAVGGIGAKIGSILSRRKSKELDAQQSAKSMSTNQGWNQGLDGRKSMDAEHPEVSVGSKDFGNDRSGSWNQQAQRYSLPATSPSYDKDLSGNLATEPQHPDRSSGNTFGSKTSEALDSQGKPRGTLQNDNPFGNDQSGSLNNQMKTGDLSGNKGSLGSDQTGSLENKEKLAALSAAGAAESAKLKTEGDGTKAYDQSSYNNSKLENHRNLATGDINDTSSNAATYGSTDVPYDSGNLDQDSQQDEHSKHAGAKAAAAGATAGGIGAMLSSVLGRKKSSGDINDKTIGNQGDISSSGNVTGGSMTRENMPSGTMSNGNMTGSDMPSGTMPSGNMSTGTMPSGNITGGGIDAPNDSIYDSSKSSTARDNQPANITTKDISSPMDPRSNTDNILDSSAINSGGINSGNKGIPESTTADMNSPSLGNQDMSTLGIQAKQPHSIEGNLDNSRGISTKNDHHNTINDNDLLKAPNTQSLNNNNEPISNGETVVDHKRRGLTGPASYIFGNELKFQGTYKVCLYAFL